VVQLEADKFHQLHTVWKEAVVRFHKIKQEDAIQRFVDKMNSKRFVNPESREIIFNKVKEEQIKIFNQRK